MGKKIALVSNLKPAKLCGVESQGMILASSSFAADNEEDVRVVFIDDTVPEGSLIR